MLNKHSDHIQPWQTPFPIWNHSVVPCPVLTVASWSAYRFLKRQVRWSGIPISFRIFISFSVFPLLQMVPIPFPIPVPGVFPSEQPQGPHLCLEFKLLSMLMTHVSFSLVPILHFTSSSEFPSVYQSGHKHGHLCLRVPNTMNCIGMDTINSISWTTNEW